jgi:hypothetical protein
MNKINRLLPLTLIFFCTTNNNFSQGVWFREIPDSTGTNKGAYNSIAVDRDNNTHIVYFDADYYDLRYAVKRNNEWTVSIIDSAGVEGVACDLVLDDNDIPHVSYVGGSTDNPLSGIKYATLNGDEWQLEVVDTSAFFFILTQGFTSININQLGQACISYFHLEENRLMFARRLGDDDWELHTVENTDGIFTKLMFRQDGSPVIRYYDGDSIKLAYSGTGYSNWQFAGRPVIIYPGVDFKMDDCVMDALDNIHAVQLVMNMQTYQYNVEYVYYNWTDWTTELVETELSWTNSISVDKNDEPVIITTIDDLYMHYRDGGSWADSLIDDQVDIGNFSSVCVDTGNNIRIALQGEPRESSPYKDQFMMHYEYMPGIPDIDIGIDTLRFGDVSTSSYLEKSFYIRNTGQAPLIVNNVAVDNAVYTFSGISFPYYLAAGDSVEVTVRFTPPAESEYISGITILSNDPDESDYEFNLSGSGTSSGTTGSLTVTVKDVYYEPDYGDIYFDHMVENAGVSLLIGGIVAYGPLYTGADGKCEFTGITVDDYEVQVTKLLNAQGIEDLPLTLYDSISVGPGANSIQAILPESLFEYKYDLIYYLEHIEKTSHGYPVTYTYKNAEADIEDLLDGWRYSVRDNTCNNLARLILSEEMVNEVFDHEYSIGNEMIDDVGELIGFLYFSNDWATQLFKLFVKLISAVAGGGNQGALMEVLEMILEEIVKVGVLNTVSEGFRMVANEVPYPGNLALMEGWNAVKHEYLGYPNLNFNQSSWEYIRMLVFSTLEQPFFQKVYVESLSAKSLEKAYGYSDDERFNGELTDAYSKNVKFISNKINPLGDEEEAARILRETADLMMITSRMIDLVTTLDVTGAIGDIADQIAFGMEMGAYANVSIAISISSIAFFLAPGNMEDDIDKIYFPDGKPHTKSLSDGQNLKRYATDYSNLLNQNIENLSEYNAVLEGIKDKINSGDNLQAALHLYELRDAEKNYNSSLTKSLMPIYSVAAEARDSISTFTAEYDSLIQWYARAADDRVNAYLNIFLCGLDDSEKTKNAAFSTIDTAMASNQRLSDLLDTVLTLVTDSMDLPPIAVISSINQDSTGLLSTGHSSDIKVKVLNMSNVTIQNVYIKINPGLALSINGSDSIHIGQLAGNEESGEYTFNVSLSSDSYKMAAYEIDLFADNAVTFSGSGTFITKKLVTATGEVRNNPDVFSCYPNPFKDEITLEYSTDRPCEIEFEIYDMLGRPVKRTNRALTGTGRYVTTLNVKDMDPGMYCIVCKKEGIPVSTKKLIHMK